MKISIKGIGKAVLGGATIIGGAILAMQGKKALTQDSFPPTLEPLGGTAEPEAETTTETPAEEAESSEGDTAAE